MTIIVARISNDRAYVGCDTRVSFQEVLHTAKMMPLVHMNAIVAHSGKVHHTAALFATIAEACSDFDDVLEKLPGFAEYGREKIRVESRYTAISLGYSRKAGRFMGRMWQAASAADPLQAQDIGPGEFVCSIDPLDPRWADNVVNVLPDPHEPQSMGAFAKGMVRAVDPFFPGMCGGRFIVAELDRSGMIVRPVCDL